MAETKKPAKQAKTGSREARLAAALRENLRRRKAQEKARAAPVTDEAKDEDKGKENC